MSRGKARGKDRAYQVLVRNVLQMEWAGSLPFGGDGIDLPFDIGGTTVTFDVVLEVPQGPVVVAECRRWAAGVKQEAVFALARKLQLLQVSLGRPVEGVLVARKSHQRGALKVAANDGIAMAVTEQDQPKNTPSIYYYEYDPSTDEVSRRGKLYLVAHSVSYSSAVATLTILRPESEQER